MEPEIDSVFRRIAALSQEAKNKYVCEHEIFATIILTAENYVLQNPEKENCSSKIK
jgi:hypothetical protein